MATTLAAIGDHTSLMLAVPEVEGLIGAYRGRYTQGGRREPAHITLLNPFFAPAAVTPALLQRVAQAVGGFPAFEYRVGGLSTAPSGALHLDPEPATPFVALITGLMAQFPEVNPYWTSAGVIVPHITVADRAPADRPDLFAAIAAAVSPQLPVRCAAHEARLLWIRPAAASWAVLGQFRLRPPA